MKAGGRKAPRAPLEGVAPVGRDARPDQREGRPQESVRLLSALLETHPGNQVVRRELEKLRQLSD